MDRTHVMYIDSLPSAWVVVAGSRAWVVPATARGWHHRTPYLGKGLLPASIGLDQMARFCCEIPDEVQAPQKVEQPYLMAAPQGAPTVVRRATQ